MMMMMMTHCMAFFLVFWGWTHATGVAKRQYEIIKAKLSL